MKAEFHLSSFILLPLKKWRIGFGGFETLERHDCCKLMFEQGISFCFAVCVS
jgi:hypothetical protein